jgi:hypothetical protein
MRCLGRLIGLGLALLFIGVFPCSLWTFNTQRIMLSGDTYKNAFKDEDFYQDLLPAVLPALLEDLENQENASDDTVTLLQVINQLDLRSWEQIAPQLVPIEWVEYAVEANLDSFLAWLEGDVKDLEIVFRTEALRRRLSGSPGDVAVQMMANALPVCSDAEQDGLAAFVNGTEGSVFPYCWPARNDLQESLIAVLNKARLDAAQDFPSDIDVVAEMRAAAHAETDHPAHDPFSDAQLDRFRASIRLWKKLLPLTLMIPLALLALIVIFAVRSSKTFFRWMGWPVILACMFTLAPLFLLPFVVSDLNIQDEVEGGFATGGTLIAHIVSNRMVELMIGQFTWPLLEQSAILILLGFVCTVVSVLVSDPDAPLEAVVSSYTTMPVYQSLSNPMQMREMPTRLEDTPPPDPAPSPRNQGGSSK